MGARIPITARIRRLEYEIREYLNWAEVEDSPQSLAKFNKSIKWRREAISFLQRELNKPYNKRHNPNINELRTMMIEKVAKDEK